MIKNFTGAASGISHVMHRNVDWRLFARILVPGVIDSTTNFVEHPRLVAQRIMTFANIVGRDRVIAGTDCGFSTFAGFGAVDPDIVWAKLGSLSEGARIASQGVWETLVLPDVAPLWAPILYAVPAHLLAYHTAIAKGTDVDQPRNLAKSVTVE